MHPVPTSLVAAVACSAAAGKNPWIPFSILFLLAAPATVPGWLMDPGLHASLHQLATTGWLFGLGGAFFALAALDSVADKVPVIERWFVPVSTAWRPFAGVAVASVIAVGTAHGHTPAQQDMAWLGNALGFSHDARVLTADLSIALVSGSLFAVTIVSGAVYGALASIGKTGARLLLTLVPIPGVRLLHSFVDDLFAIGVAFAGLAHGSSVIVVAAALVYLAVGLVTGPLLSRLAWIHVRIGVGLARKGWRAMLGAEPLPKLAPPRWLRDALTREGIDPEEVTIVPAYVYRAPVVGYCRAGLLVISRGTVWFAARAMWRPRILRVDHDELARIALAQTATTRLVSLVERLESGALRETSLYLFPAVEQDIVPLLEQSSDGTGLVRVKADSESARRAVPGFAQRGASVRFLPAEEAGSLRLQALLTIAAAVTMGILTAGTFVPIGAGYAASPHKRRFAIGLAMTSYLALCVWGSAGLAWPVAVVYSVLLNIVALRDLARLALKARVDGFVDRRAFMPTVADRVWIPQAGLLALRDRWQPGDATWITDGPWRAVVRVLAEQDAREAEQQAALGTATAS